MLWWRMSWRRAFMAGGLELLLLFCMSAALVWLGWSIQGARREMVQRERRAERVFEQVGEVAALSAELEARGGALRDVAALVPAERDIGSVVALLEREAVNRGVTLRVPLVEEVQPRETEAAGEQPAGPGELRDVRLQLVVSGEAKSVASFFRAVEHLPYLLRVAAWELTVAEVLPSGSVANLPAQGPLDGQREPEAASLGAELTLDVWLSVLNDSERDENES